MEVGFFKARFNILIGMSLISITYDLLFIISHSVPGLLGSNNSIILNDILPYRGIYSVRGFIILHTFINRVFL
jgi:hypothetical protein